MAESRIARTFACPGCGYDVTQTLHDRINVCPECGRAVNERLCTSMPRGIRLALSATVPIPAIVFLASFPLEGAVNRAIGSSVSAPIPFVCFFGSLLLLYFVARATYARFDPRDAKIRAMQLAIAAVVTSIVLGLLAIILIGFLGALILYTFT